jgi:hypothetical protein
MNQALYAHMNNKRKMKKKNQSSLLPHVGWKLSSHGTDPQGVPVGSADLLPTLSTRVHMYTQASKLVHRDRGVSAIHLSPRLV